MSARVLATANMDKNLKMHVEGSTVTERRQVGSVDPKDAQNWLLIEDEFTARAEDWDTGRILFDHDVSLPTGESWYVDDVEWMQIAGLRSKMTHANMVVYGDRNYDMQVHVEYDDSVTEGEVWFRVTISDTDGSREPILSESSHLARTEGLHAVMEHRLQVPGGYNQVGVELMGEDVFGGSAWLDDVVLRDADRNSKIFDLPTNTHPIDFTVREFTVVAPTGTERMTLELHVETLGIGWRVDDVYARRVDCDPDHGENIVRDLLVHPDTNKSLLTAGTINTLGPITFDWTIKNQNLLDALGHLLRSGLVAGDAREWRVTQGGVLHVGRPEEIFVDRSTKVVFQKGDAWLTHEPDIDGSIEDYATEVKVIGAERRRKDQTPFTVTATVQLTDRGLKDFMGNAFRRTLLIEDGSVEHYLHAIGLANETANEIASPRRSYQIRVTDTCTLGGYDVGDWVGLYLPEKGIVDPSNAVPWGTGVVQPEALRVMERTRVIARPRVVLRRSPTDLVDITRFVVDDGPESTSLSLGDIVPEYVTDPQGGGSSAQYLKRVRSVNSR